MMTERIPQSVRGAIYLAHCALHGKKAEPERLEGMDLGELFLLAKSHSMEAMAAAALEGVAAPEVWAVWKEARERALRRNLLLTIERQQICAAMERMGIWYVPLKGSVLKDLYPRMEMRQMTDQDILFDTTRREEMREYMLARGYDPKGHHDTHHDIYHKDPVYNMELHHTLFELHCDLRMVEYYKDVKSRLIQDKPGSFGYHFSDEDHYIYMTAHAFKHYSDHGVGLRSFVDVYVYEQKKGTSMDWAYIEAECEKLGMAEYERTCRTIARKLLAGETVGELTMEELEMLRFCTASGTHGTEQGFIGHELRKIQSSGGKVTFGSKVRYLWKRLFPSVEWMKKKDRRLREHPWLIPFAWIARLFRGVFRKGGHTAKELRYVMDTEDV
jgi:hypothetical protein